jgi:hypothetical protein
MIRTSRFHPHSSSADTISEANRFDPIHPPVVAWSYPRTQITRIHGVTRSVSEAPAPLPAPETGTRHVADIVLQQVTFNDRKGDV